MCVRGRVPGHTIMILLQELRAFRGTAIILDRKRPRAEAVLLSGTVVSRQFRFPVPFPVYGCRTRRVSSARASNAGRTRVVSRNTDELRKEKKERER